MTWNPFDWTAEPFLSLYVAIAAIVFAWGFLLRWTIGAAARMTQQLSVPELAYLAGGANRLGDAILLSLASGNGASIAPAGNKITVTDQTPLAALIGGRASQLSFPSEMTRQQFQKAVAPIVERVRERLQKLGYTPNDEQMASLRWNVLPFAGLLILFGIAKVLIGGVERHHPVGILIVLILFTAVFAFAVATRPRRTRAGKAALQDYQNQNARASRAPLEHELLLALALSGPIILSGTAYASVYTASRTMNSSGDGGSGCGGGGGGGGCGGCS